ncbi:MAG TPA: hypothetical protein VFB38_15480 [Chthonomonadaceae bacterium]|nr:hypothetical protein [Chthonomonadaceae bacterium]
MCKKYPSRQLDTSSVEDGDATTLSLIRALRTIPRPGPGIPFGLSLDAEIEEEWICRARQFHFLLDQINASLAELFS